MRADDNKRLRKQLFRQHEAQEAVERVLQFAIRFLRTRTCVLGIHGATHRARYPTLAALLAEEAVGGVRVLALLLHVCSNMAEILHARNRAEGRGGQDAGMPVTAERLGARLLIRDALNKVSHRLARRLGQVEDVAVEEEDSQPAAAANEDNDENAPANAFVRGSWVWRVFQSKQDFSADDFDAYKEKAVVHLECTQCIFLSVKCLAPLLPC